MPPKLRPNLANSDYEASHESFICAGMSGEMIMR